MMSLTSVLLYPRLVRPDFSPVAGILRVPPPASVLYCTIENIGSTPVVSAPITKPIVPVGAITVVCAFRNPCSSPIITA